jgi:hypothetical protein
MSQPTAMCPVGVCRAWLSARTRVSTTVLATDTATPKTSPEETGQPKPQVAATPSRVATAIWIMAPGRATLRTARRSLR